MKTKKIHPIYPILGLIWLAALVFASFYDLEISLAIADESSGFGRFLEVMGEPPAILFTSFNFSLMAAHFIKKPVRTSRDILLAVLTLIAVIGTSIFSFHKIADYFSEYGIVPYTAFTFITVCAISAAAAGSFIFAAMRMKRETVELYFTAACRCAAAAAATFVIIWAFKLIWGRVRFRQLEGNLSLFTKWYLPQGFNGFFSFPSGHTANATVIFSSVYYLPFLPDKLKKYKPLMLAILGIWITLVAFSRVRVGAHYLSDVLFGLAITLAIVYFARPKGEK